ncbi:MAG: hypothetical protein IE926_14350 [Micrococcales bacterium]|uniref:hypothetical protein n=1 Tax=Phycicoccus sp. TaxID=1902410 RepID=UPI0019AFCE0E|nr:hypothetical protein [Phycicoccus sp.]MBD3784104.1 hypothetical protein [Micrococcales bacterium]HMM94189.1 hypothetical protein [Phycicoccus sp.]
MEKTMSNGATAMAAACPTTDAVWYGSNTAHAVELGRVQGSGVSAAGLVTRQRIDAAAGFGITDPTTGSVYPRLEGPPV